MPEKNIQDDYYTSLSKDKDSLDNNISKKIKIKPKVLVVKKNSDSEHLDNPPLNKEIVNQEPKKEEKKLIIVSRSPQQPKKESFAKKSNTFFKKPYDKISNNVDNKDKNLVNNENIDKQNKSNPSKTEKVNNSSIAKKIEFKRDFYKKEGTGKNTYVKKDFSANVKNSNSTNTTKNNVTTNTSNIVPKKDFKHYDNNKKFDDNKNSNSSSNFSKSVKTVFNKDNNVEKELDIKQEFVKPVFIKKDFNKSKNHSHFSTKKEGEFDKSKKPKLSPYLKNKRFFPQNELKEDASFVRSNKINKKSKEVKNVEDIKQDLTSRSGETVILGDILSIKEFSEKIGIPLPKLIAEFMKNGMMVNLNSKIDFETSSIIAESFNIILERDKSGGINVEDIIKGNLVDLLLEDDITKLKDRPPVVSIMGHVDHGKTSLLDYIRQEKVAEGEAGGITQSIGAYQVIKNGKKITFLDTPGHEAFTIMRARGAKSTDIAILVVAADEGVKPQTIESINHAKEAGIPIIVAMNKMDKEGANPDHLKSQLAEHGLISEEWGGDVPMVPVSAKTGFGIDDLLEIILLVAEMKELKANPDRLGVGTILESHLDMKFGPVATVLINSGSISIGDNIVSKQAFGKVKVLKDYKSKNIKTAYPGDPVLIVGLDEVANGGDILQVVTTAEIARDKSLEYRSIMMNQKNSKMSSLDMIMSKIKSGTLKNLKIVLKADTNGSLEAIKGALLKLSTAETKVSIIHSGVGNITEGDVLMCGGSSAILIGFGVDVLGTAKKSIDTLKVEFISSNIIYKITEKIEKIVTGMLDPKEVETFFCNATVLGIFYTSKEFMIVGLKIKDEEKIENKLKIRVIRKQKLVGKGEILSLKRGVEEIKSIEGPIECGIKFSGNVVLEEGDILEVYKVEIQK